MCTVRVGKVAGHKNVIRAAFTEQVQHDTYVGFSNGLLPYTSGLIEGQVNEACVFTAQSEHFNPRDSL